MKASFWRSRLNLPFIYLGIGIALLVSYLMGALHLNTLNFWMTGGFAFLIMTFFDGFVLSLLDKKNASPAEFLFRMLITVILMHLGFAFIYLWAADSTSYLMYTEGGKKVTDLVDAAYFSAITLFSVGYGDIVPKGDFRFTAVAEIYGGTLFIFQFFYWGLGYIASRHFEDRK